jgi:5,5'-dehydrodivanillate O-demethylase
MEFVHTGPGTLAGTYLRMFWQPVYRSQDLPPGQSVPIRIMGEQFTLYRGELSSFPLAGEEPALSLSKGRDGGDAGGDGGRVHLLAFRCAHRGAQLSTGWVEGDCLRCLYHGWKYDASGQCVEQPDEDPAFAAQVRIASYPVREYLGLVFAYLGEGAPPSFRRFPDFERPFVVEAGPPEIWPCNYFNRIDNACDAQHVLYTHRESITRAGRTNQLVSRSVSSEETEYGIRTTLRVPDRPPSYLHFHMPNINQTRSGARVEGTLADAQNLWVDRLFWRVPIDDEHSISFVVDCLQLTGAEADAYRERRRFAQETQTASLHEIGDAVLAGRMRLREMDPGLSTYKTFWVEDYATQVGQGPVADRTNERLGRNDGGVVLLRKIWERELRSLASGRPLKQWRTPAGLADMSLVPAG